MPYLCTRFPKLAMPLFFLGVFCVHTLLIHFWFWFCVQGVCILMKAIMYLNYPWILQPLVTNIKMSMAMNRYLQLCGRCCSHSKTCPHIRSLTIRNTSHHIKVIQENNGYISMLSFSMTIVFLLSTVFVETQTFKNVLMLLPPPTVIKILGCFECILNSLVPMEVPLCWHFF